MSQKVSFELADPDGVVFEMAFADELVRIEAGESFEAEDRALIKALDDQPAVKRAEKKAAPAKSKGDD